MKFEIVLDASQLANALMLEAITFIIALHILPLIGAHLQDLSDESDEISDHIVLHY